MPTGASPLLRRLAYAILLVAIACGRADTKSPPQVGGDAGRAATLAGSDSGAAAGRDEGPTMKGDHSVIQSEAVGPLRVGEWRRPVMSFVYAISARAGRDSEDIIVVHGVGKDTVTLTFDNDTLRRVFITRAGPATRRGIGVGTPFALVEHQPGATTARRGAGSVATIRSECGVEFATDSLALSADSAARLKARGSSEVRAISVGYCKP
ncbi:MAG: hypothetical protein M3R65_06300 [Gemmatimonadota bacterium]|nr:hypothetical protein [Gemmatimonadota bacterium]